MEIENYLLYNNVNIEDIANPHYIYVKDKNECVNLCSSENNCQGVNIEKPTMNDEINNNIIKPNNLTKLKCKFIKNLNNSNYIIESENNTTLIKKDYLNISDILDINKEYHLKINGHYVGIENKNNQLFLVLIDEDNLNITKSIFKFNHNGNIIDTQYNKCIQTNGNYLILQDYIPDNPAQEFIFENKTNTLRPKTNQFRNTYKDDYCLDIKFENIVMDICDYKNKNQYIDIEPISEIKEEFKSDVEIDELEKLTKINFCSNIIYKTIVTLILLGILIYFIWFLIRKKYKDNIDINSNLFTSRIIN